MSSRRIGVKEHVCSKFCMAAICSGPVWSEMVSLCQENTKFLCPTKRQLKKIYKLLKIKEL